MQTGQATLESFGPQHIDGAVLLSQAEKWPHRPEDWALALELSDGFVALDGRGQVVGTVLVTPYGHDCATINMVIVDRAMRGLGLGRKLMEAAITLADDRPLRLVATVEGLPLYEKLGFAACGSILQHQGPVMALDAPLDVDLAVTGDLAQIKALDREAYGADRSGLIDALFKRGEFAVIRKNGAIKAYAATRAFGRGEVIGPVIAPGLAEAKALIAFFAAPRAGAFLRVDTGADTGLADWLSEIGLSPAGKGMAMRNPLKDNAEQARSHVYALANQALG